ncbi:MAG TPA: class I SAM-dependent methyltransferase [Ktedonobacterales bacterium]|nr:class I SAM-dependent methyltransferase [Ktedonobacterales bacterium]
MAMDFSRFDVRKYPVRSVREGYGEWAASYEGIVQDVMDVRLLDRIQSMDWKNIHAGADLACGTGRTGAWLKQHGVAALDGVDLTAEMLEGARAKAIYRELVVGDMRETPLPAAAYDLVTVSLADEHLPDLHPLYQEAARLARSDGYFVLVGYHPTFIILNGMPTHYKNASGESIAIETYVHLMSDHVRAALAAGWALREMHEGLIDEEYLAHKPKWSKYRDCPISFAMVWQKEG